MNSIERNIEEVRNNIIISAKKAGRNPSDTVLIAVSKTKPVEDMLAAYNAGIRDFGENKVQEILEKYDKLPKDARFHMIGHLQRNKVKQVIDKVCLIHSVDTYRLAQEISVQSQRIGITSHILVEVNMGEEESKFGTEAEEAIQLVEEIAALPNIKIDGLMTVAPYVEDPESNREIFNKMLKLSVDIKERNIDNVNMNVLSMGMTNDYCVAVEEGATMVRVGTAIFGARDYSHAKE